MIKKASVVLAPLCLLFSSGTIADSGPGCGLGQQVFSGQSGLFAHVLAATTNGSSSNQLFGLSFDSLGCDGETVITASYQRDVFVASNFDNIARDAAQGGGDHLESLAQLMNVHEADTARFFEVAQVNYNNLFDDGATQHEVWLDKLDLALAADPELARYSMQHGGI